MAGSPRLPGADDADRSRDAFEDVVAVVAGRGAAGQVGDAQPALDGFDVTVAEPVLAEIAGQCPGAVAAVVEVSAGPADQRHRQSAGGAFDQVRCRRDLVGDSAHGHGLDASVVVGAPALVVQAGEPGQSDGDIADPDPPRPRTRIRDDQTDAHPEGLFDPSAQAIGGPVAVEGVEDDGTAGVRLVETGCGLHGARRSAHDLNGGAGAIRAFGDEVGAALRDEFFEFGSIGDRAQAALSFGDDLRRDDEDIAVLEVDAVAPQSVDEDRREVGTLPDLFLDGRCVDGEQTIIHTGPPVIPLSFLHNPIAGAHFLNSPGLFRRIPQVVPYDATMTYIWGSGCVCM